MNPLTNVRNIQKLNETELRLGNIGKKSWHDQYKNSAWIFIGGLPFDLTEGDILCVFSQYGEIVNINLVRDNKTGKSKGFAFLCYEDQRSTILAVDNLNSIKLLGRTIRVDHVENYKPPKEYGDEDELTKTIRAEGCAPKVMPVIDNSAIVIEETENQEKIGSEKKKKKKEKKKKKDKRRKHKNNSSEDSEGSSEDNKRIKKGKTEKSLDSEKLSSEYEDNKWKVKQDTSEKMRPERFDHRDSHGSRNKLSDTEFSRDRERSRDRHRDSVREGHSSRDRSEGHSSRDRREGNSGRDRSEGYRSRDRSERQQYDRRDRR